ncbi:MULTISPECIES: transporter substrate-binding domain-containing protein [Pseudovibrio]|uniref:transporter substrate-binding domain-containing protein n=1 Tax=Stappiaceae TaxID=2821832 RepID=UPI0023658182|nr:MULTISPECIES: transporter substrate-binding domain-containing protein [Pseudovibrio]MDD7908488.1 transporter substrate-binding domain-containing protein [Pseudovibrio exalbescens]MDX5592688.1 transporter substrate-binding domain-containing protein [Pseudovibrio sp. SPO723]
MKKNWALAATALVALTIAGGAQAKEWTKVRIATEASYPPFAYTTPAGELAGFEIELGNAMCEAAKVECEWFPVDWEGLIPGLIANKYDAIMASMSSTEERKQFIDFSEKYYQTPPGIAVLKDSDIAEATPEALDGLYLGVQVGTTHAIFAEEKFEGSSITTYPSADEYKLDLEGGRVDAVIDDVVVLSDWLKSEDGACCKLLGTMAPVPEIHGEGVGVGMRQGEAELNALFSKAVKDLRESGKYQEIAAKYFDFDVYGE